MAIAVTSSKGDADLFVSQTTPAPSQADYLHCAQEFGTYAPGMIEFSALSELCSCLPDNQRFLFDLLNICFVYFLLTH
jgi:hypothetical protein